MTSRGQAAGLPAIGLVTAFVIVLVFGGLFSSGQSDQDPTTRVVETPASTATASTTPATSAASASAPVHFTVALVTVSASPVQPVQPVPGRAPVPVVSSQRLCLRPDPGWTITNPGDGWTADQNGQRYCRPITPGADPGEELNVQLEQR